MVVRPDRNDFVGHSRKAMIVRVCCGFGNLNAAQHLMNMGLLRRTARPALTAA